MRRPTALLIAVGAAALALTGPVPAGAAPVAPATHHVDVDALPAGPHARTAYLTGRLLHTPAGRVVRIPVPLSQQDSLELLGRSPHGWVVVYHHTSALLEVGPSGRTRTIARFGEDYEGSATEVLSSDGRLVAVDRPDEGDAAHVHVVDLAGHTVARHDWSQGGRIVGFRGSTLYFARWASSDERGPLVRWRLGSAPVRLAARGVELLDLDHRQVFRTLSVDPQYRGGVAPLGRPDAVRWQACETCRPVYLARAFSPDGRLLVGERGARHVTVRRASNGVTVSDLALSRVVVDERWEGARHLLVEVVRHPQGRRAVPGRQHALLRCSLGGHCVRVTVWQRHWLLGYPGP